MIRELFLFVGVGLEFDDTATGGFGPLLIVILDFVIDGDAVGEAVAGDGGEPALVPGEGAIEPEAGDGEGVGGL